MTFRTTDKKVLKYFQKRNVEVNILRDTFDGKVIRYLETTNGSPENVTTAIVFIHGAPGSSNNFHRYLADKELLDRGRLISIDRLGYGYSDYGRSETSIHRQSEQVMFIINRLGSEKVILVGHSYGGPIIGKCAMDHPDKISGLVMIAPVNDPENEKIFWFAHLARWKITKWLLPKSLIVSGDEKFSHADQLEMIANEWQDIKLPVIHIHGKKDLLAPASNIGFSVNRIHPDFLKMVVLPKTGHFIPWTHYRVVKKELIHLLDGNFVQ